jgi:DnaK suppressor protein
MTDKTQEQLDRYRARIVEELESLDAVMESSADERGPVHLDQQAAGRLTRMDAMQRQAMASETQRRRQLRRQGLEQALKRIDEGEFGYCAECGEAIPDGRLNIDPTFHLCVQCAD